jgi:hypothetical protein
MDDWYFNFIGSAFNYKEGYVQVHTSWFLYDGPHISTRPPLHMYVHTQNLNLSINLSVH